MPADRKSSAQASDPPRRIARRPVKYAAPFCLFLSICLGSAAASASSPQQIMGDELAVLISGKKITFDESRMRSGLTERDEMFYSNGRYLKRGDRARFFGFYYINRDAVCTDTRINVSVVYCRNIYKDSTGYYFRYIDQSEDSRWPIVISDLESHDIRGSEQ